MIRLKKIEIHINEDFATQTELETFKKSIISEIAKFMQNPPTVYQTFETHENILIVSK